MQKIGVVGPGPSVERILDVARELEHGIELVPYIYKDPRDTVAIVEASAGLVQGWLFSGPLPHSLAVDSLGKRENFYYCPRTENGFFDCILQMTYHNHKIIEAVSVDMMEPYDVEKWLREAGVSIRQVYVKKYSTDYDPQKIVDFHMDLWKKGETEGAITVTNAVYTALRQAGVPAYQHTATRMEIGQALLIVDGKAKSAYYRTTQVGLVRVQIDGYDEIVAKMNTPYELQALELKIKQCLLPICQQLNGYFVDQGNGCYEIFSTRGAVKREVKALRTIANQLKVELGIGVVIGIGFGATVFAAEINSRKAVQSANRQTGGIIVVQDQGMIVEVAGEDQELAYAYSSTDAELTRRLANANVGIRTYKKVESIIRRMNWQSFTAEQLAEQMGVTSRNVRRILAGLCAASLAACVGEEVSTTRGRPGKIYRLEA